MLFNDLTGKNPCLLDISHYGLNIAVAKNEKTQVKASVMPLDGSMKGHSSIETEITKALESRWGHLIATTFLKQGNSVRRISMVGMSPSPMRWGWNPK
jgi:hypothetical protein